MAAKQGLYANIQAKRKRIAKGSGEKMRKPGEEGAPAPEAFRKAAKTANKATKKKKSVAGSSTGEKTAARKPAARKTAAKKSTTKSSTKKRADTKARRAA